MPDSPFLNWLRPAFGALPLCLLPVLSHAQEPLSAIDWIERGFSVPVLAPAAPAPRAEIGPPVTQSAQPPEVTVSELGKPTANSVGLLSSQATGLPPSLWLNSDEKRLVQLIRQQNISNLPAMQSLLYTLLLAEADEPHNRHGSASFLRARIDALLRLGAVEPAKALLERAGPETRDLFPIWMDVSLLSGGEDKACDALMRNQQLAGSYATRVYCTARSGDWMTAALTLDTARALGIITDQEDTLLSRFLDPELAEESALPLAPVRPSPLIFRLYEAMGEPLTTAPLPLAFATADLRDLAGWKARVTAAERLARSGALPENQLLGIYSERLPAASGGIWDRIEAVQRFDTAMTSGDPAAIGRALPRVWAAIRAARLEVPFAKLYGPRLMGVPISDQAAELRYRIVLLSPKYEDAANQNSKNAKLSPFLTGLAKGAPDPQYARSEQERAIVAAFGQASAPADITALMEQGKLGEAILLSMLRYQRGAKGDVQQATRALSALRAIGLEDVARRAALQMLILNARG